MENLPDSTEVEPLNERDEPMIQEVIAVLRKHNSLDRFGLTLLHQHFALSDEEVLVERTDSAKRTQTIMPCRKAEVEHAPTIATAWRLDSGKAVKFSMCLETNWATGDHRQEDLGDRLEANEKVQRIMLDHCVQPDVLEACWNACAQAKNWGACLDIAAAITKLAPTRSFGWIHRSFALHELKRTQEAFDQLLPVANRFPRRWTIPFNLACYCAQSGRLDEGKAWLKKAIAIDERAVKQAAMNDPDLTPIGDAMKATL